MANRVCIFDLDGTLTVPTLDFDAIRAEMGLSGEPILEAMARMSPIDRARAEGILEAHERRAAQGAELQEGATDTVGELARRGYGIAILTRNARRWTQLVLEKHGLAVDAIRCRDDGTTKPSAEPIRALCGQLGGRPQDSWMIGDHLFDIRSGREAGSTTVLMLGNREAPEYTSQANHVIRRLPELLDLVW